MFNNDVITNFSMQAAVIIPIITAIVQAFKFWINENLAPFVAMLVGIGITFLFANEPTINLSGTILTGLLFGLASSGLYSGLQTTAKAIKLNKMQAQEKKNQCNKP